MFLCSLFLSVKMSFPTISIYPSKSPTIIHRNCHLISHYSHSFASSPSPSSSSLSSPLPLSTAFPFPFCVDPPPPTLPCMDLPTKPKCTRASLSDSTVPIRCSCLASCFQVTLSHCSHNLRSAHHNSFTLQATSTLSCFPLAPNSLCIHIVTRRSILRAIESLVAAVTGRTGITAFGLITRKP